MTVAYYMFKDAGMNVQLASIQGGKVPVDDIGKCMTNWDKRFWDDKTAISEL